ncbi:chromatin remodeling complex subunit (Chd3) [Cordyceps javanica]|uniref:Chromatin remodeling complex subunit (Chd3) n=1 Tax=Cordyceps javanica TaxID=43265 RepID=A0A545VSS1_9HYPO|nr:chromatin remodeling complex subunit (Chd3) [Cordyceps javanica]TQW04715.1 chromatin remodeling complex subunit (Chd3) [Cordyceps javanica]
MDNQDGPNGLDTAIDTSDYATRNSPGHAGMNGAILADIGMTGVIDGDIEDDVVTGISGSNVGNDIEDALSGEDNSHSVALSAQPQHTAADFHDPKEDNAQEKSEKGFIDGVYEAAAINSPTEISVANTSNPWEDAIEQIAQQEDSGDDFATSAKSAVLRDYNTDDPLLEDAVEHASNEEMLTSCTRDGSQDNSNSDAAFSAHPVQIEIRIPSLPEYLREDYSPVVSEVVDHIRGSAKSADAYHVEFTDGRVETVTRDQIYKLENGQSTLAEFLNSSGMAGIARKRKNEDTNWDSDFESEPEQHQSDAMELDSDNSDESIQQLTRRSSRRAAQKSKIVTRRRGESEQADEDRVRPSRPARSLRPRASKPSYYGPEHGREALQLRDSASDDDFLPVISDLAPAKKIRGLGRGRQKKSVTTRRRPSDRGSDIEFEPLRRSSRATKNVQGMNDEFDSDDDFESMAVVKERGAPKVISVKEIFQPIEAGSPFALAHMQKCQVCAGSKQRGQLIYCQGCSLTFHKACIGIRSAREHMAIKVDDEKEYLVKWETKSYAHCTWLPGAWVFGVAAPLSRKAFRKRDLEQSLLRMNEKDAIPDEFLAPDIILVAKMDSTAPTHRSKEEMLGNISYVRRIFVKFQGLGYEDVVWDAPPTPDMNTLYSAFVEAYGEYVNGKYFEHETQTAIRDRIDGFKHEDFRKLDAQPKGIRRGKLMGYQLEGLNWLLGNYHHGRSVVLADEMGLGKTVQVVSLVTSLVQDNPKCWPFLIVVPNATCPNWRREFRQWAPDVRVIAYHGGKEPQELTYRYELFPEHTGSMRAHVVIMSYDSAQDPRTAALFKSVKWAGLVVDEGQRLKNDQNLLYQALSGMKIPFRLLLTGTPLQNNKRELFNLVQFIDTSQDATKLDLEFEVLDKETLPKLHDKIRPYFLRRTKAGVLKFLPPMAQIIVPVTMTVVQEKLAKSIMSKNPELIKAIFADTKLRRTDRGSLNNILMQLRKCLCHPFMYSENIEEKHHDPVVMFRNLIEASAKLLLLEIMLPKLKERGHRVLIFSQFLQQLDIIEDFLIGIGCEYRRLDGGMSSLEKQKRIDAFNEPNSPLFAFLLSTRAGGVGINLATADTVIIMDPDFNPHQDLQALSRAHRIGQKNKVLCFQFMTKDSVEERIVQVGRSKMALDHALIESMDDDELEGADLESILKHGASALFNDDYQKTKIQYTSAMVDSLLDRSQIEQATVEENSSGETPFAQPRVWDSDKVGFDSLPMVEAEAPLPLDSGVWDKIIAQREEEARRKAIANREILGRGGRRRMKIDYTSKVDAQQDDAEKEASSDSDEFSKGDGSSESDDEPPLTKEDEEATLRELTKQTKTTQRPAQSERVQTTAIASRWKGPIKEKYVRVPLGDIGAQPDGKVPEGTNAARGEADHWKPRNDHISGVKKRVTGKEAAPSQTKLVPDEFWHYISRLGSEVEIRVAIDEVAHSKEQRMTKQMRLYALHEKLRQVSSHRNRAI